LFFNFFTQTSIFNATKQVVLKMSRFKIRLFENKKAWDYIYRPGGTGIPYTQIDKPTPEVSTAILVYKLPVYQDKKANALYFFVKICTNINIFEILKIHFDDLINKRPNKFIFNFY